MYLGHYGAFKLPSFTPASNCSIPKHPVKRLRYAVTGIVNGKIMSCGGIILIVLKQIQESDIYSLICKLLQVMIQKEMI